MNQNNLHLRKKIQIIVERYINLLPEGEKVKYHTFVGILKKHFTGNNPLIKQDIDFLKDNYDLIWKRQNNSVTLTRIV